MATTGQAVPGTSVPASSLVTPGGAQGLQGPPGVIPSGVIWEFAGTAIPSGWLACDGASYPTATYPALFTAIGYTWGGSGANFNVPDLRGRTIIGVGQGTGLTNRVLAAKGGEETHTQAIAELPVHNHTATSTDSGHAHVYDGASSTAQSGSYSWIPTYANTGVSGISLATRTDYANITTSIANTGSGTPFNVMAPFAAVNKMIKT